MQKGVFLCCVLCSARHDPIRREYERGGDLTVGCLNDKLSKILPEKLRHFLMVENYDIYVEKENFGMKRKRKEERHRRRRKGKEREKRKNILLKKRASVLLNFDKKL